MGVNFPGPAVAQVVERTRRQVIDEVLALCEPGRTNVTCTLCPFSHQVSGKPVDCKIRLARGAGA